MKIKRILLTGDDGYNSIGIRLLVHFLKNKYDLNIVATKVQQSGVGGKLSIKEGGQWGKVQVDGVPALWVSGTPGDAMELVNTYFKKSFDLVLSGINLGPNIVGDLASGTFTAAVRAIKLQLAPKAIAFSWVAPASFWYRDHQGNEDLATYSTYPGEAAYKLINLAITNNFWDNYLLNINFPDQPTKEAKFTRFAYYFGDFFNPLKIDKVKQTYSYPKGFQPELKGFVNTDADALRSNYISITPCKPDLLNDQSFQALKGQVITLS